MQSFMPGVGKDPEPGFQLIGQGPTAYLPYLKKPLPRAATRGCRTPLSLRKPYLSVYIHS